MKKLLAVGLIAVLYSHSGAAQTDTVAQKLGYPQMIVFNGKIVTMDDNSFESRVGTIAQAMAIRDGRILATGSNAEIRSLAGPETRLIDVKGRTVLPGFILGHEHPTDWVFQHPHAITHVLPNDDVVVHRWLPNVSAQEQLERFKVTLPAAAAKARPGQWILISFNRYAPDGRNVPGVQEMFNKSVTKQLIDQLAPINPVKVKSGFNNSVINEKAMEELRIVHPTLSVVWENPENSTPNFNEWLRTGGGFNRSVEPDVMFKNSLPLLASILKAETEWWAAWGVTTIGSSPYAYRNLQAFDYLDKKGELPIRYGWAYTGPGWTEETMRYLGGMQGHGTDHLWMIGAWGRAGATGCMSISPSESTRGAGGEAQCALAPEGEYRKRTEMMIRSGLRIATMYTNGDKDVDYLLDAIENASKDAGLTLDDIRAKRHSIDGGGASPRPDQIARLKKLGMMMTLFNGALDGGPARMAKTYGPEYANWVVPRMSLTKAGVMTANGVDAPVPRAIFHEVLRGITRYDDTDQKVYAPGERADRVIQLKALTRWGAYSVLRENTLGTLEPGKFADFIVLDKDFLTIPENDIASIRVLMTTVGGKVVHLAPALAGEFGAEPIGPSTWKEKIPAGW